MTIPKQDAERMILAGKASYTSSVSPEISAVADAATRDKAAIDALGILLHKMNSTMAGLSEDVSSTHHSVEALAGQVSTLTSVAAVEGIAIVVVAVLAVLLRRKPT